MTTNDAGGVKSARPAHGYPPKWGGCYRVLSLDGGGAKGMYTLGILTELEKEMGARVCDRFDLVYGVSTGSIIAALLVMGRPASEIKKLYKTLIPQVMKQRTASGRSKVLKGLLDAEFKGVRPEELGTHLTVVCFRKDENRPMVFKYDPNQLHSSPGSYVPGFGVPLASVVLGSCSARPYFKETMVEVVTRNPQTGKLEPPKDVELIDGGFSTSNPALFAATDAKLSLRWPPERTRMLSLGTGKFAFKEPLAFKVAMKAPGVHTLVNLFLTTLDGNVNLVEQMRGFMHKDIPSIRIDGKFEDVGFKTSLLESDPAKLEDMYHLGVESFEAVRQSVRSVVLEEIGGAEG